MARPCDNILSEFREFLKKSAPAGSRRRPVRPGCPKFTRVAGSEEVRLACRRPFDGAAVIDFLARRAIAGIEEVVDGTYRRSLRLPHGAALVELTPAPSWVRCRLWLEDERDRAVAVQRCRSMMDLDRDPAPVAEVLGRDPLLAPLLRASPGRRVPGHVDGNELAARAVLGQQVSVAGARTLAARLVATHGTRLESPIGGVTHLFPTAAELAAVKRGQLAMPESRKRALCGLAGALAAGEICLQPGVDSEETERRLLALPGIGPWTASYIAMRALKDSDAFLPSDLGVRRALESLGQDGAPRAALRLAESWRPYRAYATQHLWAMLGTAAPAAVRTRSSTTGPAGRRT
jgi:AraC family transcriptional regulator, regulatory protein of adaptative response / DNA-3-methyladenine glycosylase II